jgi:hypothetical protein
MTEADTRLRETKDMFEKTKLYFMYDNPQVKDQPLFNVLQPPDKDRAVFYVQQSPGKTKNTFH